MGQLLGGKSIVVKIRARLWNTTFLQVSGPIPEPLPPLLPSPYQLTAPFQDFRDVDQVRISSKAAIEIDPKLNVKQLSTANDIAYVS